MQTIKIKLDQKTQRTDCPNLHEKSIRVCNFSVKEYGWFRITTNKPVSLSMKSGQARLKHSTVSVEIARDAASFSSIDLTAGEHFFYIDGIFNDELVFSDITALDTFNATTSKTLATGETESAYFEDSNVYIGMNVYVNDLPKLSMVKMLLVKHSLYGINRHCQLDMRAFKNLTVLHLGHSIDLRNHYIDAIILDSSLAEKEFTSIGDKATIESGIQVIYQ